MTGSTATDADRVLDSVQEVLAGIEGVDEPFPYVSLNSRVQELRADVVKRHKNVGTAMRRVARSEDPDRPVPSSHRSPKALLHTAWVNFDEAVAKLRNFVAVPDPGITAAMTQLCLDLRLPEYRALHPLARTVRVYFNPRVTALRIAEALPTAWSDRGLAVYIGTHPGNDPNAMHVAGAQRFLQHEWEMPPEVIGDDPGAHEMFAQLRASGMTRAQAVSTVCDIWAAQPTPTLTQFLEHDVPGRAVTLGPGGRLQGPGRQVGR